MNSPFTRFVSRLLIVCLAALPLQLQAGMIGTGAVVAPADAQAARDTLRGIVDRAGAAGKLQAWGLTPQEARARVAALTDQEAADLLARAERAPAGADGAGIGLLIILIFLVWHFIISPALDAEAKKTGGK